MFGFISMAELNSAPSAEYAARQILALLRQKKISLRISSASDPRRGIITISRIRRGGAGCAGYVSPDSDRADGNAKVTKRTRSKLTVKNGVIAGRKCNSEQTPAFGEASDCSKAEELRPSR